MRRKVPGYKLSGFYYELYKTQDKTFNGTSTVRFLPC